MKKFTRHLNTRIIHFICIKVKNVQYVRLGAVSFYIYECVLFMNKRNLPTSIKSIHMRYCS